MTLRLADACEPSIDSIGCYVMHGLMFIYKKEVVVVVVVDDDSLSYCLLYIYFLHGPITA